MKTKLTLLALSLLILGGCTRYECVKYKTYCYYTDSDTVVAPVISSNGGFGVGVGTSHTDVYVECDTTAVPPSKLKKENKCVEEIAITK